VFYFNYLEANGKVNVTFNVLARIPGTFEGQASRSYIYYDNEHQRYIPGLKCKIVPLKE